jgi:curved DNA-binding protein CbpA
MPHFPEVPTRELISPALYERFRGRIADDLAERPLALPVEEHRVEVARRLQGVGAADAYEILGLGPEARDEEVTRAYTELARRVHPDHAGQLHLPEPLLRLLFEHATRAYLTLSDPERRQRYDREHRRTLPPPPRSEEELLAVRREMARKSFARAQSLMRSEQFHYVVELLREAVRWDPRPEVYALLADAQSRNPHWRAAAVENLREAVRLAPREVAYRLRLAQVLEEAERSKESQAEYEAVLSRFPNHPEALAGLERLRAGSR